MSDPLERLGDDCVSLHLLVCAVEQHAARAYTAESGPARREALDALASAIGSAQGELGRARALVLAARLAILEELAAPDDDDPA